MATPTPDRGGSIRLRAAVLTSALVAVALIAVIAYTFFAIRISLVRVGEARATATATQIAGIVAAPLPARLAEVQRLVEDDSVRALLSSPTPEYEAAVTARLRPILAKAVQHQTLELWTAAGQRALLLQTPETGSSVPPSTTPPTGVGVLPYTVVNKDVVVSEVVVEVRAAGPDTPVLGHLLSRRMATNPNTPDTLNRLIGSGGRVYFGNQVGPVWTDIKTLVAPPPIDARTAGVHQYVAASGDAKLASVVPLPGIPLAIVVEFPLSQVVAPAWALLRQLALVGLVFTLIAVAVVWRLSARVTQPLDQLADALRGVSGGDFSRRLATTSHSEVGRLGDAFNSMAAKIQAGLEELEAQAHQKAAMMNAALDSIITTDADGWITDCNPAAARVFGYEQAAIVRQNLRQLLTLTDLQAVLGRRVQVDANREGGGVFPAELSLIAIESDGVPGFAAFVRDLTEQKAGEESLRRGIMLQEENRRVQEASRLKSEFLANMSHELRTPLNAIIGFAELLYDGQVRPDMPQFKEFMHDILTSGQHLLQLINDVLDLSKVEAGRLEFHPEDTDLQQVVTESIGVLRTLAAQKQLTIAHEIDPAAAMAFVDRARLKQVLYNYLSNAIKFTREKGRVEVRVRAEGEHRFRIEVTDTGIGISPEDQRRLFIEFNQLEAGAAKKHQGTGLGLALTKRLIEAQGGTVGVQSVAGQGSTFFAVLPRRATSRAHDPAAGGLAVSDILSKPVDGGVLAKALDRAGVSTGLRGNVLVVEDDPGSQRLMAASLSQLGYTSVCVERAIDALRLCQAEAPLAVVLDLQLPEMDGFAFLEHFRVLPACQYTPVIVWTVKDLTKDEHERLRMAQGVMGKGQSGTASVVAELRRFTTQRQA
jgi:PAS domain S-box-containing protein